MGKNSKAPDGATVTKALLGAIACSDQRDTLRKAKVRVLHFTIEQN